MASREHSRSSERSDGSWPAVLSSVGHISVSPSEADIFVVPPGTPAAADWHSKVQNGAALILEGSSPLAASFGFRARSETVSVIHVVDVHNPALPVIWSKSVEMPRFDLPKEARVFATERWTGAPLIAGLRVGSGAVLWVGTHPGQNGYERFP